MPTKYLLRCDCGSEHTVTTHQAGSQVSCGCGKQLDIPPLRKLRHLPLQPEQIEGRRSDWTLRHSFVTGGTLVCLALLVWAGWLGWTEPEIPRVDPTAYLNMVEKGLEQGSPANLWSKWHLDYQTLPERGFEVFESPQQVYWERVAKQYQLSRNASLAIAGVVAAACAVGYWLAARPTAPR